MNKLHFYIENIHFYLFRLASLISAVVITYGNFLKKFGYLDFGCFSLVVSLPWSVHIDLVTIYLTPGE